MPRFLRALAPAAAFALFGPTVGVAPAQEPAAIVPLTLPDTLPAPPVEMAVPVRPAEAVPCPAISEVPAAFDFKNVPPVRPQPRTGNFPIPPTGPGYYSILDAVRGTPSKAPPIYGYPRFGLMAQSSFDLDFRYLDKPGNTETDFFDPLKRIKLGDDFLLSLGGQSWIRQMNEYNSRIGPRDNSYTLTRQRLYADLWFQDRVRLYAEGIAAFSNSQDLPSLPIDQTGFDFLNLFMDFKLADVLGKAAYLRVGRQELLFGSQRLVSTLDWANTRRTFQGVSVLRTGEKWDINAFWVQPVVPKTNQLDWADNQQNFSGAFLTYRPKKGQSIDLYDFVLTNNNTVAQRGIQRGDYTINTLGARYAGDQDGFLWDFESALQLGRQAKQDVVAGMATAGVGYNFKDKPWNPTFWVYYDYATGDGSPGGGRQNTFNQLFPFGHYYLGWADIVGRQNIQDANAHMYLYPTKWLTLNVQYHAFRLANARDALYNAAGNVSRFDRTGRAGRDVGQEVDIISNFHVSKHADILVGYSHLFAGDFIKKTAPASQRSGFDTSLFYLQASYRW